MDRHTLSAQCQYFDMVHGVTLRAIDAFTDSELGFRPQPAVRTPRELIFHIYSQERTLAEAARLGRFTADAPSRTNPEDPATAADLQALTTVNDVRTYAAACHQAAQAIYMAMSDSEVNRTVESPFGTYPAWRYFAFAYDEHWHHRGQLYTYLRMLGKEPPSLYDY